MGNNSNTIRFSTIKSPDNQPKGIGQLSIATEEALSIFLRELNARLKKMLSSTDDHLFDKSGKSDDSRHFMAMRTLRVKKDGLLSIFEQEVTNYFRESVGKIEGAGFQTRAEVEELSFENLALVNEDDLEERIAIDSMTSKARKENKIALNNLRQRLEVLLPSKIVSEEINPFEPSCICNAFSNGLKPIQLGVEFKLVLYKYFERNIIEELDIIYQEVNNYFVEHGILPELKSIPVTRKSRIHQPKNTPEQQNLSEQSANNGSTNNNDEILGILSNLLAEKRGSAVSKVTQQVSTDELVGVLSQIQITQPGDQQHEEFSADVRRHIVSQLPTTIGGKVTNGALGQFNDDMIDVVTMLFDFILDDDNLHSEIKAIIARLQIPILKVGLVDKTFFSNRKHTARLLLNELAHAGLSWDPTDTSSEAMLGKIKSTVEKICCDFTDNVEIFDLLLENFLSFKSEHVKRSKIFEKRTREAEEGKAKAQSARARVNQELKKICFKRHIPEVAQQLLKSVWVHVMFLESLRADNEEWDKVCKLAKMLVWSMQPVKDQVRLDKLIKCVPILIKNLKLGFNKISFSHIESSGLLDRLEDTHREIIKNARNKIEQVNKDSVIRLMPVAPFGEIEKELEKIEQPEENEELEVQEVKIEEIAFSDEEIGRSDKTKEIEIDISDESVRAVENLHAGSWFELKTEKGIKRCKLAARIVSIGKFIFVNRSGVKVSEFLTNELAAEYQLGNLRILDDEALFDRALESVISNLRSMKASA